MAFFAENRLSFLAAIISQSVALERGNILPEISNWKMAETQAVAMS